jgi:hypothetical protein
MNSSTAYPTVPAGFVPVPDVRPDLPPTHFQGATATGDGWQIEVTFNLESGVEFEVMPSFGDYSRGGLTTSQAIESGNALAVLGAKYAASELQ